MRFDYHEPKDIPDFETGFAVARMVTAKQEDVETVLAAPIDSEDGRSEFMWVRLSNGDLLLGVFPQAGTYELFMDSVGI